LWNPLNVPKTLSNLPYYILIIIFKYYYCLVFFAGCFCWYEFAQIISRAQMLIINLEMHQHIINFKHCVFNYVLIILILFYVFMYKFRYYIFLLKYTFEWQDIDLVCLYVNYQFLKVRCAKLLPKKYFSVSPPSFFSLLSVGCCSYLVSAIVELKQ